MRIPKFMIIVLCTILFSNCQTKESNSKKEMNTTLFLNHTGYRTNEFKKVILQSESNENPSSFEIIDTQNQVVFKGSFLKGGEIDNWHTGNAYSGDFSELKKQGITIDYTLEFPIVTYMGDTSYTDFSQIDYIAKSKILIIECTFFLDEHRDRADAGKHMHIDEFAGLIEKMENEHVIVTHLSQRIGVGQAKSILRKSLTPECYKKTTLLMDRKWFS